MIDLDRLERQLIEMDKRYPNPDDDEQFLLTWKPVAHSLIATIREQWAEIARLRKDERPSSEGRGAF